MGEERVSAAERTAFFGAVSAGFSHEINNVVSIMSELAGLITDILEAGERGRPVDMAKLKEKTAGIAGAAKRGETLIKQFNRFAHTPDNETAPFSPAGLLADLLALIQRKAAAKKITLALDAEEGSGDPVEGSPFLFVFAVHAAIRAGIDSLPPGESVSVCVRREAGALIVETRHAPVAAFPGSHAEALERAAAETGASFALTLDPAGAATGVSMSFPAA